MSDSDRQLYFADFVIELQAAEDEKRRRIRDARRRAEKAQREGYRELLKKLASDGKITPYTRWRSIQDSVSTDEACKLVQAQDRDAPHELFEEFLDEWNEGYRRERSFLGRLVTSGRKEIRVRPGTSYDQFTKLLLDEAAYSPDVYGDVRRIINREQPVSSARLHYDELMSRTTEDRKANDDSSEDEGEIIEDGEVAETSVQEASKKAATDGEGSQPVSTEAESGETKVEPKEDGGEEANQISVDIENQVSTDENTTEQQDTTQGEGGDELTSRSGTVDETSATEEATDVAACPQEA
jgi:pre-mRNA-processing factor 40